MNKTIIWRDDDTSKDTDLKRFKEIHSLFIKYKVLHTVSLICAGIETNKPLVDYIKKSGCDVQVHAWEHFDYTTNLKQVVTDLPKCVKIITKLFGKRPDTLFPPWNRSNPELEAIAWANDLAVSNKKISLDQFLRGVEGEVLNFHGWHSECDQLEAALKKYTA